MNQCLFKFAFLICSLCISFACAPKKIVSEPIPPSLAYEETVDSTSIFTLKSVRANIKSSDEKPIGFIHFSQTEQNLKLDIQLEGLKSGPYSLYLSDSPQCRKLQSKRQTDYGEVIAGKNGVVKQSLEHTHAVASDLLGKSIVIYTKAKHFPRIVACGAIEKN